MSHRFSFNTVVMQPTSLCNLNCNYCYLPERSLNRRMLPEIAAEVARFLEERPARKNPFRVLWHCGEPLASGLEHFKRLVEPFAFLESQGRIVHSLQTNGTLLNEEWCAFFKAHKFEIGVSLDGPFGANANRVDWQEKPAYHRVLKGIETLKKAGLSFGIIAVVNNRNLGKARELYEFFSQIDCESLSINLEETLGINRVADNPASEIIINFWKELFEAWQANPILPIREFGIFSRWQAEIGVNYQEDNNQPVNINLFPSIGSNGDMVLLSPDFLGSEAPKYNNFLTGNILKGGMLQALKRAKKLLYVQDFIRGKEACQQSCSYYAFCGGGYASNKFFELGSTEGTETIFCLNSRKLLFDTLKLETGKFEAPTPVFTNQL